MKYLLILGLLLTGCSEDAPVQLSSTVTEENGTVIETYSDGTVIKTYSDGTKQETKSDGSVIETYKDGATVEKQANGTIIWRDKNGGITERKTPADEKANQARIEANAKAEATRRKEFQEKQTLFNEKQRAAQKHNKERNRLKALNRQQFPSHTTYQSCVQTVQKIYQNCLLECQVRGWTKCDHCEASSAFCRMN